MISINRIWKSADKYYISAIIIILTLVIYKLPVLSLPYFWDEAWSYIPAISQLFRHGPSMLPDALPAEVYRGHPMLFYFLASLWMTIFGASFISMHAFALLITCLTLITLYHIVSDFFSPLTGLTAMIFFILQPILLGQATFVLPEMLVTLFCLLSIYYFIKEKILGYLFFASLLLYTKESGLVLIGSVAITCVLQMIFSTKQFISLNNLKKISIVFLPVLFVSIFFLFQKKIQGWYFFPQHMSMMNNDWTEIKAKFLLCYQVVFKDQKRVYISMFSLVMLAVSFFVSPIKNDQSAAKRSWWYFFICCLFVFMYMVFCAINFFAVRYLLCAMAFWCILVVVPIARVFAERKIIYTGIVLLAAGAFISENAGYVAEERYKVSAEYNLGFADAVKVQRDMCDFLQTEDFYQKKVYGTFLFLVYLTNPDAGYLHKGIDFLNMMGNDPCQADFVIYSSIEKESTFEEYSRLCNMTLVKRFERGFSWVELYKPNKTYEATAAQ